MKPVGEVIWGFGVECHRYVDDSQLYLCFPHDTVSGCFCPGVLPEGSWDLVEEK